jgi:NAD(P)-dependent dehydrogenase (short-subunit alcohol dehydrogenase family)
LLLSAPLPSFLADRAGIFDTFQIETASIGIRSMIVQPGYFRTDIFSTSRLVFSRTHPNKAYDDIHTALLEEVSKMHKHHPGDPDRAAHRIVDVVKSEGMAAGKPLPKRLPLGEDAVKAMRFKCEETLRACEEWEEASKSTTFEGGWDQELGLLGKEGA